MEIKFNAKDRVRIPDGCKATIKDGIVIFEKDFEDGDVLHSVHDDLMLIYKESSSSECFSSHFNTIHNYDFGWNIHSFRHASEEEKHQFFFKMKEQGLRWNAEEKRVEKIRWRAEKGDDYYYIDGLLCIEHDREEFHLIDDDKYNSYNYFRTREQTEKAAEAVRETLRKFHEENE